MNKPQPIKIAILAMGGEGGGVLADWIVDMGEANGYVAQTTSVPGVRTPTKISPPASCSRQRSLQTTGIASPTERP